MSTLDYGPVLDGAPYDPQPEGGEVTTLALYTNPEHTGSPTTFGPAVRVAAHVYRFTIPDSTVGRFWPRVTWTPETAGTPIVDDLPDPLDLPIRDDMVIAPEALAARLGITLPISSAQRQILTDVILDAQADVVAYLGRPILPVTVAERRTWPPGAWEPNVAPLIETLSEVEVLDEDGNGTGYWDWTYRAGLDARSDPTLRPIRRLLLAHAAQQDDAVRLWATVGSGSSSDGGVGSKRIKSLSAEGQSVSFEYGRPGSSTGGGSSGGEAVGGPVRWHSIDDWRIRGRRVFQPGGPTGGLVSLTMRP